MKVAYEKNVNRSLFSSVKIYCFLVSVVIVMISHFLGRNIISETYMAYVQISPKIPRKLSNAYVLGSL